MRTLIVTVLVLVLCAPTAFAKKWTDVTGKYIVEAEFVEFKEGKVRLKTIDGKVVVIALENLILGDQAFVKAQSENDSLSKGPEKTPQDKDARPRQGPFIVQLVFEAVVQADRRVFINGKTNLPPGTVLMVSLVETDPNGFSGNGKCSVLTDGSFQAEARPLGPHTDLKKGSYAATVTMPFARMQPAEVQGVIGVKGENLRGPIVKYDKLAGATSDELEGAFLQVKKRVHVP